MEGEGGGGVVLNRVEIDTRAPFRSVKEAVMLFGEKVLAGEVYGHKFSEMRAAAGRNEHGVSRIGSIAAELEETRENLNKAQQETLQMASYLHSLRDELERTKKELRQLKARELEKQALESEIEDIKFVENPNPNKVETKTPMSTEMLEFQKKRCVTFANPPSLARVMNPEVELLHRQFSVDKDTGSAGAQMKKKKKPLIPLIGGIFSKKKGHQEARGS